MILSFSEGGNCVRSVKLAFWEDARLHYALELHWEAKLPRVAKIPSWGGKIRKGSQKTLKKPQWWQSTVIVRLMEETSYAFRLKGTQLHSHKCSQNSSQYFIKVSWQADLQVSGSPLFLMWPWWGNPVQFSTGSRALIWDTKFQHVCGDTINCKFENKKYGKYLER